jgi:tetratricopeptide (TPR) repeat protein
MVNKKKQDEMRERLVMRAKSADVLAAMGNDQSSDPELWYRLGVAYGEEKGPEAAIEAFSEGLVQNPFNSLLYFGRGRKNIGLKNFWRSISDFTMAIRLEPEIWNNGYYRAVSYNLNGYPREAISDFRQCLALTDPEDWYPLADWIFLSYVVDMGQMDKARESLDLIDLSVIPPQMDYAYRRRIQLYKGFMAPEDFIDPEHIKTHMIEQPDRLELEIKTLTFGLFVYYTYVGQTEKANEQLLKIAHTKPSAAFGYIKAMSLARVRGLV